MTSTSTIPLKSPSSNGPTARSHSPDHPDDGSSTGFARIERMQQEAMSRVFSNHGGFIDCEEVTQGLRGLCDQPVSRLARWIVSRSVISIPWGGQTMMPAFQFSRVDMSILPCVTDVLDELRAVFDNWELALWFAVPNAWLAYASPVSLLAQDAPAVFQAARSDRFIALG